MQRKASRSCFCSDCDSYVYNFDFIPPSNMTFPDGFPKNGSFITVLGTMKLVTVGEDTQLCFLAASVTE